MVVVGLDGDPQRGFTAYEIVRSREVDKDCLVPENIDARNGNNDLLDS